MNLRRRVIPSLVALVLAAAWPTPAFATEATAGSTTAEERVAALTARLDGMLGRYGRAEIALGKARLDAVLALADADAAAAAVAAARARVDERLRAAYETGPLGTIDAVLGAGTLADVAAVTEFAARTLRDDRALVHDAVLAEAVATARRAHAEATSASLEPRVEQLRSMLARIEATLADATALAERIRLRDEARAALEAERRRVEEALDRTGSWDLGVTSYREDQGELLALLGPTGGRTCDLPDGLVATGRGFSGFATWYGWEFAGRPTATGAIFDPDLFTAANRWLPFGTFLRVRAGDGCAIVLVNDRGPYGHEERVLDLSMAAGHYLGVGVTWVDAEILLPASALAP